MPAHTLLVPKVASEVQIICPTKGVALRKGSAVALSSLSIFRCPEPRPQWLILTVLGMRWVKITFCLGQCVTHSQVCHLVEDGVRIVQPIPS